MDLLVAMINGEVKKVNRMFTHPASYIGDIFDYTDDDIKTIIKSETMAHQNVEPLASSLACMENLLYAKIMNGKAPTRYSVVGNKFRRYMKIIRLYVDYYTPIEFRSVSPVCKLIYWSAVSNVSVSDLILDGPDTYGLDEKADLNLAFKDALLYEDFAMPMLNMLEQLAGTGDLNYTSFENGETVNYLSCRDVYKYVMSVIEDTSSHIREDDLIALIYQEFKIIRFHIEDIRKINKQEQ